jgi:hypothetical protein
MMFHFGFELPIPVSNHLNHEISDLTQEEIRIVKNQIRRNRVQIDDYVMKLELFVNKERYPVQAIFLQKMRRRLVLLMEENDTFRKVLWKHYQKEEMLRHANRYNN